MFRVLFASERYPGGAPQRRSTIRLPKPEEERIEDLSQEFKCDLYGKVNMNQYGSDCLSGYRNHKGSYIAIITTWTCWVSFLCCSECLQIIFFASFLLLQIKSQDVLSLCDAVTFFNSFKLICWSCVRQHLFPFFHIFTLRSRCHSSIYILKKNKKKGDVVDRYCPLLLHDYKML